MVVSCHWICCKKTTLHLTDAKCISISLRFSAYKSEVWKEKLQFNDCLCAIFFTTTRLDDSLILCYYWKVAVEPTIARISAAWRRYKNDSFNTNWFVTLYYIIHYITWYLDGFPKSERVAPTERKLRFYTFDQYVQSSIHELCCKLGMKLTTPPFSYFSLYFGLCIFFPHFTLSLSLWNTHTLTHTGASTHTAYRTVMSTDRLLRSALGLCDRLTPGDCCGDGSKLSTFNPPDTLI